MQHATTRKALARPEPHSADSRREHQTCHSCSCKSLSEYVPPDMIIYINEMREGIDEGGCIGSRNLGEQIW